MQQRAATRRHPEGTSGMCLAGATVPFTRLNAFGAASRCERVFQFAGKGGWGSKEEPEDPDRIGEHQPQLELADVEEMAILEREICIHPFELGLFGFEFA